MVCFIIKYNIIIKFFLVTDATYAGYNDWVYKRIFDGENAKVGKLYILYNNNKLY